jgi:hypothetical protein
MSAGLYVNRALSTYGTFDGEIASDPNQNARQNAGGITIFRVRNESIKTEKDPSIWIIC